MGIPCRSIKESSMMRKIRCVMNELASLTTGKMLRGKTTFFTKWGLLIIILVEPLTVSAKVIHMAIPAVSQTTKGIPHLGTVLIPMLNTSHKMNIIISGLMKVQKKPSMEPTCWVKMSRLAISRIKNFLLDNIAIKTRKSLNNFLILDFTLIHTCICN